MNDKARVAMLITCKEAERAIRRLQITKEELTRSEPEKEFLLQLLDAAKSSVCKARSSVIDSYAIEEEE